MGRRKLRFDLRRNYDRKKCGLKDRTPLELLKPSELVVRLPTSAYNSSEVTDATRLHTRLSQSNKVPPGWIIAQQPIPAIHSSLALCKVHFHPFRQRYLYTDDRFSVLLDTEVGG